MDFHNIFLTGLRKQFAEIDTRKTHPKIESAKNNIIGKNSQTAQSKYELLMHVVNSNKTDFLWIKKEHHTYLLDLNTKYLWNANAEQQVKLFSSKESILNFSEDLIDSKNWRVPLVKELRDFSKSKGNPLQVGSKYCLWNRSTWLALEGDKAIGIALSENSNNANYYTKQHIDNLPVILVNSDITKDFLSFFSFIIVNNFQVFHVDKTQLFSDSLQNVDSSPIDIKLLDYNRARLPKITEKQLSDPHLGLWEFWGDSSASEVLFEDIRARNPAEDIQNGNIGIDFGTSSTVVAYEDENGRAKLLRVGVDDFFEAVAPEHYENPTVLEFLDFQEMLKQWTKIAQQPFVNWDTVRCSHEALHNFRNNDSNPKIVSSILTNLKQWALREAKDTPLSITDQIHQYEHTLAHLSPKNPVKGVQLQVSQEDTFDPIELYAWFLGLNINWRGRGIFLKYYLSFPVAYPKAVKENILASFRRGLLRSLPQSLTLNIEAMDSFTVEERASEPAAYVASAMDRYKIEPTDEGVAYSVFDFGGGTTDFDYGYYRWANDDEDSAGIEEVFEHFEAAGDQFLGGENLLENLAYLVFKNNIDLCRENKIAFTKPLDADDFPGSESLIGKAQEARTNTLMLMSRLRPFWEKSEMVSSGIESLDLLNIHGERIKCELSLDYEVLGSFLENRIHSGIESFFIAMKKAYQKNLPKEIHILLAGNSSRSTIVLDSFGLNPLNPLNEIELMDAYFTQKITLDEFKKYYDQGLKESNTDLTNILDYYFTNGIKEAELKAVYAEHLSHIDYQKTPSRFDKTRLLTQRIFNGNVPKFIPHKPLEADINNESSPTAKTGVALGILRLCPGTTTKVINHAAQETQGEAPFSFYVGRNRRKKFLPGLLRNDPYGQWKEIGVVAEEGIFNLFYTQSNQAFSGDLEIGNNEIYKYAVEFPITATGQKVFVMPHNPSSIKIVAAEDISAIDSYEISSHQLIQL